MEHRTVVRLLSLVAVGLALVSAQVLAARVSSQPRNGYQRVNFAFDAPTQLKVDRSANGLVLHFSTPIKQSPTSIQAALGGLLRMRPSLRMERASH